MEAATPGPVLSDFITSVAKLSVKGQIVNIFSFATRVAPVTALQLCCCSVEQPWTLGKRKRGCLPIQLYIYKKVALLALWLFFIIEE